MFIANSAFPAAAPFTKTSYKPQHYDTPTQLGVKWQMDVKYVPKACYSGFVPQKFYQYTVIDETSRERFIYPYMEQSGYSTVDFLYKAIAYFGYKPASIQTDNGSEFTHIKRTNLKHTTPRHNGKVERSHRNDQERFYNHMSLYTTKT